MCIQKVGRRQLLNGKSRKTKLWEMAFGLLEAAFFDFDDYSGNIFTLPFDNYLL